MHAPKSSLRVAEDSTAADSEKYSRAISKGPVIV
jgi:hypothetical protein